MTMVVNCNNFSTKHEKIPQPPRATNPIRPAVEMNVSCPIVLFIKLRRDCGYMQTQNSTISFIAFNN